MFVTYLHTSNCEVVQLDRVMLGLRLATRLRRGIPGISVGILCSVNDGCDESLQSIDYGRCQALGTEQPCRILSQLVASGLNYFCNKHFALLRHLITRVDISHKSNNLPQASDTLAK